MPSNANLRAAARDQLGRSPLSNNWTTAVLVIFITYIAEAVVNRIVPGIGGLLILGPIGYSVSFMFLKQTRDGECMKFSHLIKGFTDDFAGVFLLGLLQMIFVAVWSILLVIPGIMKAYSYAMAYYVKVDRPEYGWRECLDSSTSMMYGHRMELFLLDLSFIGWFLLGSFVFGVGSLWAIAYWQAARSQFYDTLAGE